MSGVCFGKPRVEPEGRGSSREWVPLRRVRRGTHQLSGAACCDRTLVLAVKVSGSLCGTLWMVCECSGISFSLNAVQAFVILSLCKSTVLFWISAELECEENHGKTTTELTIERTTAWGKSWGELEQVLLYHFQNYNYFWEVDGACKKEHSSSMIQYFIVLEHLYAETEFKALITS